MSESHPTVILINRALAYNIPGKVTGMSGAEYGESFYQDLHGAHVCRMSLEQWRACRQDVTNGAMRRACQWEVDFELPQPVQVENGQTHTAASLAAVPNYRQLLSMAKKCGVEDAEAINSTAGLREAILVKQGELQPA